MKPNSTQQQYSVRLIAKKSIVKEATEDIPVESPDVDEDAMMTEHFHLIMG